MTAPASPPRLTDKELHQIEVTLLGAPQAMAAFGVTGARPAREVVLSLVAEVRSSRLAAERAEGVARAMERVKKSHGPCADRPCSEGWPGKPDYWCPWCIADAALAAYRGSR